MTSQAGDARRPCESGCLIGYYVFFTCLPTSTPESFGQGCVAGFSRDGWNEKWERIWPFQLPGALVGTSPHSGTSNARYDHVEQPYSFFHPAAVMASLIRLFFPHPEYALAGEGTMNRIRHPQDGTRARSLSFFCGWRYLCFYSRRSECVVAG